LVHQVAQVGIEQDIARDTKRRRHIEFEP
jgi:hypothetical protein